MTALHPWIRTIYEIEHRLASSALVDDLVVMQVMLSRAQPTEAEKRASTAYQRAVAAAHFARALDPGRYASIRHEVNRMEPTNPEAVIACAKCGSREWFAFPDGANSFILECPTCGTKTEIAGGPNVTLSATELPTKDEQPF